MNYLWYTEEMGEGASEWLQGEFKGGGGRRGFSLSLSLSFLGDEFLLRSLWKVNRKVDERRSGIKWEKSAGEGDIKGKRNKGAGRN